MLAKTDPTDARILARFADQVRPTATTPKSPAEREMNHLARRRRQLVGMIVAEKNRLESADPCIRRDLKTLIQILERRVAKLDARLDRIIAALVGVAPFARDSGRKQGTRWIRAGRAAPRTALYLAAMNGVRFNPVLRRFYERLIEAGKPPKLAFIALARKLLTILNAMVRDRTNWQQKTAWVLDRATVAC